VKLELLILPTDPIALLDRHASFGFAVMDFDNLPAMFGDETVVLPWYRFK
jgi:hypothetical protein